MKQLELLAWNYPDGPGAKASRASHEAAERVAPSAKAVRQRVHDWLSQHPEGSTAERIATCLFWGNLSSVEYATFRNSVRSRLSELTAKGTVRRSPDLLPGETAHRYYLVESADGTH